MKVLKNFKPRFCKLIGQVNFRPTLLTYDNVSIYGSEFENKYEEWKADNPSDVALYSPSERKYIHLLCDSVTYLNEKQCSLDEMESMINKVVQKYVKDGKVKEFRRVGVKTTYIYESNFNFSDLNDLIHSKLYSKVPEIDFQIQEVVHILHLKTDNVTCRVHLGPVKKNEIIKNFDPSFKMDLEKMNNDNLFLEIDTFIIQNASFTETQEHIKKLINTNSHLIEKYMNYLDK